MDRRIVEQSELYVSKIGSTSIEQFANPVVYDSQPIITISGGSGSGSLHFSTQPVDGACTVTSSGKIAFKYPGKSWIFVYKDGSDFTKTEKGKVIQCTYQRSKLLVVEIEWKQRQIIIKVAGNQYIKIGDRIPSVNQSNYTVTGLLSGDSLKTKPTLFFVYQSDDFYKLDVFSHTYSDDRYDNGIRYVKNSDGSWTVSGEATGTSYYNLLISPTELPDFFRPGRSFKFTVKEKVGDNYKTITNSPVRMYLGWYRADGSYVYNSYLSASTIIVPTETKSGSTIKGKAIGVLMKLRVESNTNLGSGRTFLFNMIYTNDRSMDNLHVGAYPIGARYAVAPDKIGYDQKIQYRSNKGKLMGLYVQNNKKYYIYLNYNEDLGRINTTIRSDYPYTDVTFYVESEIDTTYSGPLEPYVITEQNHDIDYNFLYDINDEVTLGSNDLYIEASLGGRVVKVPFKIIKQEKSNFGQLNSGTYQFRIPISNCTIYGVFHSLNFDPDDPSPEYTPEWITEDPPYLDIFGPKSGSAHYKVESKYWQAVVFCYFARQVYFGEDIPLMQGTTATTFYNVNVFSGDTNYGLLRRDLITVVNRISHALRGIWPDVSEVRKTPDQSFYDHAASMNAPQSRLFTYAGYPQSPKYEQKWHWVNKEVKVQEAINYCIVSAEAGANIRSEPNTTSTRLAVYQQGTIVQLVSVTNGWAGIYKLGSTSEVVYTSNKNLTPISTYEDVTVYEPTQSDVNVRKGPGNGYSKIAVVHSGYAVLVTSVKDGWAKVNAIFVPQSSGKMQKVDYSKAEAYVSAQYLQLREDQSEITKTVKEKVYDKDLFGQPVYSNNYELDPDGNIQYQDIQYTRYNGKFPGVPVKDDDNNPTGASTERTIDWLVMNHNNPSTEYPEGMNPYGANDDYLINYGNLPNIAWGSYIGVMNGYNEQEFGASSYATYQEAVTVLWRYARFRQFDIMGDGGYYMEIDDSDVAYWAQHGPWRWAISRGIFDGYRMRSVVGEGDPDDQPLVKAKPTDYINRAEWAYMVYKFCTMYAW